MFSNDSFFKLEAIFLGDKVWSTNYAQIFAFYLMHIILID